MMSAQDMDWLIFISKVVSLSLVAVAWADGEVITKANASAIHEIFSQHGDNKPLSNNEIATYLAATLKRPHRLFVLLLKYLFCFSILLTSGTIVSIIEKLANFRRYVKQLINYIYNLIAPWTVSILSVPYNAILDLIAKIVGPREWLNYLKSAGNLLLQSLVKEIEPLIHEWFGTGKADDRSYKMVGFFFVAATVLVIIPLLGVLWFLVDFAIRSPVVHNLVDFVAKKL